MLARLLLRRDTAANWTSANPTLAAGEYALELDTQRFKNGDGATAWTGLPYAAGPYAPTGTVGVPVSVTALSGITVNGNTRQLKFIVGAGAVVVTATPQVQVGTLIGQELVLRGTDNVNTVTLADANGLNLNGPCVLRNGSTLYLIWDGATWSEVSRNDK